MDPTGNTPFPVSDLGSRETIYPPKPSGKDMMPCLAINRPVEDSAGPPSDRLADEHVEWIDAGMEAGTIVHAGRWGSGGACMVEAGASMPLPHSLTRIR